MSAKVLTNKSAIRAKVTNANREVTIACTTAIIEYGNIFVREDSGDLKDSSYIASDPEKGEAVWDMPYAKRMYYTGTPVKDKNPNASLMWAEKGVNTYRKELDQTAQNAFNKGFKL